MPRMLSLWLDFGAKAYECDKGRTRFFSTLYFLYHALIYMIERAVKYISDGPAIRKSHLLRMQSDDCDSITSALDLTSQNVDSS